MVYLGVSKRTYCLIGRVVASCAGDVCLIAALGAGSCLAAMVYLVVSKYAYCLVGRVIASCAGDVCLISALGAGRCLSVMVYLVVSKRVRCLVGRVVTSCAGDVRLISALGAGSCLCVMLRLIVSKRTYSCLRQKDFAANVTVSTLGKTAFRTRCRPTFVYFGGVPRRISIISVFNLCTALTRIFRISLLLALGCYNLAAIPRMSCGRNTLALKRVLTHKTYLIFLSCRLTGSLGLCYPFALSVSKRVGVFGFCLFTYLAGICRASLLGTGGRGVASLPIAVSERLNAFLSLEYLAASRAFATNGKSLLLAGGGCCGNDLLLVRCGDHDLLYKYLFTDRAFFSVRESVLGARCGVSHNSLLTVIAKLAVFISASRAYRTRLTGGISAAVLTGIFKSASAVAVNVGMLLCRAYISARNA